MPHYTKTIYIGISVGVECYIYGKNVVVLIRWYTIFNSLPWNHNLEFIFFGMGITCVTVLGILLGSWLWCIIEEAEYQNATKDRKKIEIQYIDSIMLCVNLCDTSLSMVF